MNESSKSATAQSRSFESATAQSLLRAYDDASLLDALPSRANPGFDLDAAFRVADAVMQTRMSRGEKRLGWKIGFTNRGIWDRYGVHAPIWGPVWDTTLAFVDAAALAASVSLAGLVQPRLEPEIMFRFKKAPEPGMDEAALARSIEWVAHGFEIVHTHCPDWRFKAADTVADFALHGRLIVGKPVPTGTFTEPARDLASMRIGLHRDGALVEEGTSDIVLDGPLTALRLWVDAMACQKPHWPIAAGDIVSTGTITDAAPLRPRERWHTSTSDPRLPGVALTTRA